VDAVRGVRLVICALILTFLALPIYSMLVPLDGDYSDTGPIQYTRTVEVTVDAPSDNGWPKLPKLYTPMLERYVMPDGRRKETADPIELLTVIRKPLSVRFYTIVTSKIPESEWFLL